MRALIVVCLVAFVSSCGYFPSFLACPTEDVQAYLSCAEPGFWRQEGREDSRHPGRTCRLA